MIRLATQEDRTTIERLCAKEPWDGTEVMTAYLSALCGYRAGRLAVQ